jgi:hypothetical protein
MLAGLHIIRFLILAGRAVNIYPFRAGYISLESRKNGLFNKIWLARMHAFVPDLDIQIQIL